MPIRNDLTPAAIGLEPMLGDFMADLRSVWGPTVLMTGSGSGCFGLFADRGEADDAARAVRRWSRVAFGADFRSRGVARVEE
jgi:4-diphosphocytidyl-2-C-methyl-D-erythritol kinase